MQELDQRVAEAVRNEEEMNRLLADYEFFILKCARNTVNRPVDKSADEWSVALSGFHEAILSYRPDRGKFLSYAELIIKRRIIDYLRKEARHRSLDYMDPMVFDGRLEEEPTARETSVLKVLSVTEDRTLADEIEAVAGELKPYGFTFMDLTEASPHTAKTRAFCRTVLRFLLSRQDLLQEIDARRQLPVSLLESSLKLKRKGLETYRRYLLAALVILRGDYPGLQGYLSYLKDE